MAEHLTPYPIVSALIRLQSRLLSSNSSSGISLSPPMARQGVFCLRLMALNQMSS